MREAEHMQIDVVTSPEVPPGTAYLVPRTAAITGPMRFRVDPWPDPPPGMPEEVRRERQRGLDFLADLIDRTREALGLDPEQWRRERQWQQDRLRVRATYMAAMPYAHQTAAWRI